MNRMLPLIILLCVCYEARGQSAQAVNDNLPSAPSASSAETAAAITQAATTANTPNVPKSYRPASAVTTLTWGMKLNYYLRSTISFRNFLEAGFLAGIPNLPSAPSQPQPPETITIDGVQNYANAMDAYGDAMDAWRRSSEDELRYRGRRFGVGLATAETRQLLSNFVIPVALRQDPRYVPAYIDGSFGERMWHAVSAIAVTRSDSGHLVPNYSKIGGTIAAAYIGKTVYAKEFDVPQLNTGRFAGRYIGYSLAGDAATNVGRELVRTAIRSDIEMYSSQGTATQDSYYPLSAGGKFFYWVRSTWGLRNFIQGALMAGIPNVPDQPEQPAVPNITTEEEALVFDAIFVQYGKDIQAWRDNLEDDVRQHERRFIGGFSASQTQQFLANFALPVTLGMDPRYIPLGPGHPASSRIGNAFTSVGIGHMDSGRKMINLPLLAGTVGAAFAAKELYYPRLGVPELENNRVLAKTIVFNFAADGLLNLFGEFFIRRGF
ncbi:MAG TPA: hypothetical protein VK798_05545 [Alloacidobacterium sp.]|jgi:hypothetical protein|nr:hypothetical protein [Alloacidobacterium sp.]